MPTPRLADVHCTKINFAPGDRLLVRLQQPIEVDAMKRLRRAIEKWAGDHVEVLIIDPSIDISIERGRIIGQ